MKAIKIIFIIIQLALGGLMVFGGINKFQQESPKKERQKALSNEHKSDNHQKIEAFIDGMKGTGYFWEFLGIVEIIGGLLLISQIFALLGAFILLPVTINIFLMHVFLESDEISEVISTTLFLVLNLLIIFRNFDSLKPIFFKIKNQ